MQNTTCDMRHMSMNEFIDAFTSADGGETLIYAVGDLSKSRFEAKTKAPDNGAELAGLCRIVWEKHERGDVFLTQRRVVKNVFEYRVTKALKFARVREAA